MIKPELKIELKFSRWPETYRTYRYRYMLALLSICSICNCLLFVFNAGLRYVTFFLIKRNWDRKDACSPCQYRRRHDWENTFATHTFWCRFLSTLKRQKDGRSSPHVESFAKDGFTKSNYETIKTQRRFLVLEHLSVEMCCYVLIGPLHLNHTPPAVALISEAI